VRSFQENANDTQALRYFIEIWRKLIRNDISKIQQPKNSKLKMKQLDKLLKMITFRHDVSFGMYLSVYILLFKDSCTRSKISGVLHMVWCIARTEACFCIFLYYYFCVYFCFD